MNKMIKTPGLLMGLLSNYDSKFEKLDGGCVLEKSIQSHLSGKLRKLFAPPAPDTVPEKVVMLLQKIETEFDRKL